MAANYIVVNSKFKPFSYAEMLQPIQMATEAHQAIEDEYAELATKASVWEGMADAQKDPYAYSMYKNYADALEEQATQLAREGLTPGSRKDILNMRKRYSSDIIPIEQAYQRRKELIDEQRKLLAQDNTLMFDKNATTLSLDDLIRNPELSYQSYAGSTLMNQVGSAAKNLIRQMRENPREWNQILGGQYFETKMKQGYTPEEILLAAANDEKAPKELRNLVEDAITSSGIRSWNDENILRRAYDYARQGLWNAVGETKYQTLQNRNWDLAMKQRMSQEETPARRNFGPRVLEGAAGEKSENLKTLEGLRMTDSVGGFSTNALDKAQANFDRLDKELKTLFTEEQLEENRRYRQERLNNAKNQGNKPAGTSAYGTYGRAAQLSQRPPENYYRYEKVAQDYEDAKRVLDTEKQKIEALVSKYDHLGNTPYEKLQMGMMLEEVQQAQEKSSFPLSLEETSYNKVRSGIKNILGSISKEALDRGNVGLRDSSGNSLDYSETKAILDDIGNVQVRVAAGNKEELQIVHNGKAYSIHGIEQIDNFNKQLQTTNNFLKDFSSDILPYVSEISDAKLEEILTNGIMNTRVDGTKLQSIPGTPFKGAVLYNPSSKEYIKIMVDKDNNIVAANSLSEELRGGAVRDTYLINMANTGLDDLIGLVAKKAEYGE